MNQGLMHIKAHFLCYTYICDKEDFACLMRESYLMWEIFYAWQQRGCTDGRLSPNVSHCNGVVLSHPKNGCNIIASLMLILRKVKIPVLLQFMG